MATKAWERFRMARRDDQRAPAFRPVLRGPAVAIMALALVTAGPARVDRAWGQCPQLQLVLDHSIEVFRVSDFDPSDGAFHPYVFTVSVCAPDSAELRLVITSQGGEVLAEGVTEPFLLSGSAPITITNRDMTTHGSPFELHGYQVSARGSSLEDVGRLPEGSYCFDVELLHPDGSSLGVNGHDCLTVHNPTSVELQRFGGDFGPGAPIMLDAHPLFQWSSRAGAFRFRLCKAMPGDASDEEVMNHRPEYEEEIRGASGGLVSFTYPSSAEDLTRGHTYCWQVAALVETSGGQAEIPSRIFCFRRWDPADIASLPIAEALADILPQLAAVLGVDVQGTPTGEILLDGVAVDAGVAAQILEGIQSGRLEILTREVQ